jgi:hypothetical protein
VLPLLLLLFPSLALPPPLLLLLFPSLALPPPLLLLPSLLLVVLLLLPPPIMKSPNVPGQGANARTCVAEDTTGGN